MLSGPPLPGPRLPGPAGLDGLAAARDPPPVPRGHPDPAVAAPARGLVGDIDQFVVWVHGIAVDGWNRAYDQNLSFPAVMAWIWGGLAAIEPAFQTVTDSSDPGIRALMKVPASLADLGIAAAVVGGSVTGRELAVLAAGAVLLWPAVWYVSAWWGQYESIYVLGACSRSSRPARACRWSRRRCSPSAS